MATQPTAVELALADATAAVKQAAAYVEATQPLLDQFNLFRDSFVKRAHQVAGDLAARGIIGRNETAALVDKLASNPLLALDLVVKVAGMAQPDGLGKTASDVTTPAANAAKLNPYERLALYGDSQAGLQPVNTGLVD